MAAGALVKVAPDALGDEGRKGCGERRHGLEAGVKRLIGREFVFGEAAAPEAFAVQAHVPVREVFAHEIGDRTRRRGGVVVLQTRRNIFYERIQQRDDPAVDLGPFGDGDLGFIAAEAVDIGVKREETVCVVESSEEFAPHLVHPVGIEFEVVPRLRVGDHVPPPRVDAVLVHHLERIDGVAEAFRHLVAVFVEHQPVGNDILKCHAVEQHSPERMQSEEPSARLVDPLGDEIGGEMRAARAIGSSFRTF